MKKDKINVEIYTTVLVLLFSLILGLQMSDIFMMVCDMKIQINLLCDTLVA